jgi:hypothetical protein
MRALVSRFFPIAHPIPFLITHRRGIFRHNSSFMTTAPTVFPPSLVGHHLHPRSIHSTAFRPVFQDCDLDIASRQPFHTRDDFSHHRAVLGAHHGFQTRGTVSPAIFDQFNHRWRTTEHRDALHLDARGSACSFDRAARQPQGECERVHVRSFALLDVRGRRLAALDAVGLLCRWESAGLGGASRCAAENADVDALAGTVVDGCVQD